eukprot:SAG31_NODE_16111_length_722_cov_1.179775_1_plen_57_part_10
MVAVALGAMVAGIAACVGLTTIAGVSISLGVATIACPLRAHAVRARVHAFMRATVSA